VTTDEDPARSTWRNYLGPVILTSRRRWFNGILLAAWAVTAVVAVASGRYDIVWLPLVGMATSSVLLLRDRAGRRRSI